MWNRNGRSRAALGGVGVALFAVAPSLHAQVPDTVRAPAAPVRELRDAVPGWECPMPVVGLGTENPSAPSGMPIVPIDSTAAVPMPTLRRHCLNPRAIPAAGPGRVPGGRVPAVPEAPPAASTPDPND
jgi:hypothetical protein